METKLGQAGLAVGGSSSRSGLHSPYWWLKCAVGVHDDDHPLARAYHRLLVWDIMAAPAVTRLADRVLNPVIGKSLVIYAGKDAAGLADQRGPAADQAGQDGTARPADAPGPAHAAA